MKIRKIVLQALLLTTLSIVMVYYLFLNVNDFIEDSLTEKKLEYSVPDKSKSWQKDILVEKEIYVIPYIGDIDGEISKDWYYFLGFITRFYEEEKIPVTFSFYPVTISKDPEFIEPFMRMYNSDYIELMQKEFIEEDLEKSIESLKEEFIIELRKNIIIEERNYFKKTMENLGVKDVVMPISYTQLGGRITEADRKALEESGIKFYFDVYYNDDIGPISSTDSFDVIQYGVGFTKDGDAGPESIFITPEEVIKSLGNYNREDIKILTLNGIQVIPLWVHQQDFESYGKPVNVLSKEKWQIYTETLLRLKEDPNVTFITPNEIYKLRHDSETLYLN